MDIHGLYQRIYVAGKKNHRQPAVRILQSPWSSMISIFLYVSKYLYIIIVIFFYYSIVVAILVVVIIWYHYYCYSCLLLLLLCIIKLSLLYLYIVYIWYTFIIYHWPTIDTHTHIYIYIHHVFKQPLKSFFHLGRVVQRRVFVVRRLSVKKSKTWTRTTICQSRRSSCHLMGICWMTSWYLLQPTWCLLMELSYGLFVQK